MVWTSYDGPNFLIRTLVLISDADGVHVLYKLALNFDQVILCVTKSFNFLGRKTWTYKNKSQTCQWEWEVTVCIGRNRYFKQANSKRKSNIWECVSIITFFRIPSVFQTRLLKDGMWMLNGILNMFVDCWFWEGKQTAICKTKHPYLYSR